MDAVRLVVRRRLRNWEFNHQGHSRAGRSVISLSSRSVTEVSLEKLAVEGLQKNQQQLRIASKTGRSVVADHE
jgi:hypothetical protein